MPVGQSASGVSLNFQPAVPTYADLPDDLGPDDIYKGYPVKTDGLTYVWSGTEFPSQGHGLAIAIAPGLGSFSASFQKGR